MAKHAGSRWLDLNWDTLPKRHWVAANDSGMITESSDYNRVVDELIRHNVPIRRGCDGFHPGRNCAMTTITFPNHSAYQSNRPYADVVLNPKARGGSVTHKCLVDTGADYLQLPASAARASSLSLATARPVSVSTVAGAATMQMLKAVRVDIEGYLVTVDVLFDSSGATSLIAGRQVLLAAFSLGFRSTDWLWT